jgi:4-hydroxyphenylpyruvate dioxygenase
VRRVDRPNFGICLDTFNIAGSVWADPASVTTADGKTANADAALQATLAKMLEVVDVDKVFYVQIVDAERMRHPLVPGHAFYVAGQPARMSWSRNARLFAFEEGGYLPVLPITKTILDGLGYRGWVSMELFSRTMADPDPSVPAEHARRAGQAWKKLQREISTWGIK